MKQMIYVVEDDSALKELYAYSLESEFDCRCFDDAPALSEALEAQKPDLIILDIMLPGADGFDILRNLKTNKTYAGIPVIMVSSKGEEILKVKGLNMGADDYIPKPFGILELIARIKANLRKVAQSEIEDVIYKDIRIDRSKHQIHINGQQIKTTLKEYDLLLLLITNPEKVQDREKIFSVVWGSSFIGETRTMDIHIKVLRKKLVQARSAVEIQTVRGVGYMAL